VRRYGPASRCLACLGSALRTSSAWTVFRTRERARGHQRRTCRHEHGCQRNTRGPEPASDVRELSSTSAGLPWTAGRTTTRMAGSCQPIEDPRPSARYDTSCSASGGDSQPPPAPGRPAIRQTQCPLFLPPAAGRRHRRFRLPRTTTSWSSRTPSHASRGTESGTLLAGATLPGQAVQALGRTVKSDPAGLLVERPAAGRCELICFSQDHAASFADLTADQAEIVLEAWIDRTTALSAMRESSRVFCFENRGPEIGATLSLRNGQIHARSRTSPHARRACSSTCTSRRTAQRTGRNLFDDMLAAELSGWVESRVGA